MRVLDCRSGFAGIGVWVRRRLAKRETEGWKCDRNGVWGILSVMAWRGRMCYVPIPKDNSFQRCCILGLFFGRHIHAASTAIWEKCFDSHLL